MAQVEFVNVGKKYITPEGEMISAVENFTLTIKDGEFICVLGPSGCGKSTILSITAGLLNLSEGKILFDRHVISPIIQKKIGVVFQDSSLFPWRTIQHNVEIGMELAGINKAERNKRAIEALELVGLKGFEKKYPRQLSGGMRQRAGLARTLVNHPQFILMDEPFSAVDYLTKLSLQDEIIRIWMHEKKTIFFVTHDIREAVYLADRVVLLSPRPGHIQHIFPIEIERPRNRADPELLFIENQIYAAFQSQAKK